jgi:hypothetical protein
MVAGPNPAEGSIIAFWGVLVDAFVYGGLRFGWFSLIFGCCIGVEH